MGDSAPGGGPSGKAVEHPRSLAFHWLTNMVLASVAFLAGALFGERIPADKLDTAFLVVAAAALALVPLTRHWERAGIEKRRRESEKAAGTAGAPEDENDKLSNPANDKQGDPPDGLAEHPGSSGHDQNAERRDRE